MTIEQIIEGFKHNPEQTRMLMFKDAFDEAYRLINGADFDLKSCEFDLNVINYSHFCETLGWPDFQDGGVFEQVIEEACMVVCHMMGFKASYVIGRAE
ncbi:hypothetical protein [Clavibacter sp.]|uniref:hypothetical protein n=1 Tax=Clavibacter sp. TaxID=1871044 RepID=UPI0019A25761|nr:hypothetical protein [Clavibacter sp.]MBD5381912.1 hypothetical protein [Clavibacter sp.]